MNAFSVITCSKQARNSVSSGFASLAVLPEGFDSGIWIEYHFRAIIPMSIIARTPLRLNYGPGYESLYDPISADLAEK